MKIGSVFTLKPIPKVQHLDPDGFQHLLVVSFGSLTSQEAGKGRLYEFKGSPTFTHITGHVCFTYKQIPRFQLFKVYHIVSNSRYESGQIHHS